MYVCPTGAILPDGEEGSISTLPLGWPDATRVAAVDRGVATQRVHELADYLAHFEDATGRLIHVDIEPESLKNHRPIRNPYRMQS